MFTRVRATRFPLVLLSVLSLAAACGGDDSGSASETPSVSADSSPDTPAPATDPTTSAPPESMRGKRYCEILLLAPTNEGIVATVYNTFPLGDCPADEWAALDTPTIAKAEGAIFALANGPRYWLMDEVGRDSADVITKTFGTIPMNRYATVTITDPKSVGTPFTPQKVDRKATFTFRAGQTIYVLTADDGRRFVMQSWSQQREPSLEEADLADLGSRLELPAGWTYAAETLAEDLVVGADRLPAEVLQDNLLDSYSLIN